MKPCPYCQQENPDHARFCVSCGAELDRQCSACGQSVPAKARFCPHCGAMIVSQPPVPWLERTLNPAAREGLHTTFRALAATMAVLGLLVIVLTPPPRVLDDLLLFAGAATLWVLSEIFKGRKAKLSGAPDQPSRFKAADDDLPADITAEWPAVEELRPRGQPPDDHHGPSLN